MTKKVVLRDIRVSDLDSIESREPIDVDSEFSKIIALIKHGSFVKTLTIGDDVVLGVAGITPWLNGVAEYWSILSKKTSDYPITFHKACYSLIDDYSNQFKIRKIQSFVLMSHVEAIKWIKLLGFEKEGLLKDFYGSDQHAYVFGRVN